HFWIHDAKATEIRVRCDGLLVPLGVSKRSIWHEQHWDAEQAFHNASRPLIPRAGSKRGNRALFPSIQTRPLPTLRDGPARWARKTTRVALCPRPRRRVLPSCRSDTG